jgi:CRP-like cAMP-binding protein
MLSNVDTVSRAERVIALRSCADFETLTAAELWRMAASLRLRRFAAGENVTLSGMPLAAMQFIVSGRVDLLEAEPGRVLGPRDVIGDLTELLDEGPASRAVAREPTITLEFDRAALEDLLEDDSSIFLGVLRATARRLVGRVRAKYPEPRARRFQESGAALDLVARVLVLKECARFARAELAALAALAEGAVEFELAAGVPLFDAEDPADHFVVLTAGNVRVEAPDGSYCANPAEDVGMIEALAGEAWPSASAETPMRGLRIGAVLLIDTLEDYPGLGLGLLRALAREVDGGRNA